MPRIRTLKPEHRQHRKVGPLSHVAYRLWVGMILEADDDGRLHCDPGQLRAAIFPYHPEISHQDLSDALREITKTGLLQRYASKGLHYAWFPSWKDHQRIHKDHYTPSKLPVPPKSRTSPVPVPYRSRIDTAGSGSNGRERNGSRSQTSEVALATGSTSPTVAQIQAHQANQQDARSMIRYAFPNLAVPENGSHEPPV